MNTLKFSDSQILAILEQAEASVPKLCREHNMSSTTFHKWRSKLNHLAEATLQLER